MGSTIPTKVMEQRQCHSRICSYSDNPGVSSRPPRAYKTPMLPQLHLRAYKDCGPMRVQEHFSRLHELGKLSCSGKLLRTPRQILADRWDGIHSSQFIVLMTLIHYSTSPGLCRMPFLGDSGRPRRQIIP